MIQIITFLNFVATSLLFLINMQAFQKKGLKVLLSVRFWFINFYIAYFCFPSILLSFISFEKQLLPFYLSDRSITVAALLVCITTISLCFLTFTLKYPEYSYSTKINSRSLIIYFFAHVACFSFFALSLFALIDILRMLHKSNYFLSFFELDELGNYYEVKFHFYSFRYIIICSVFYLYAKKNEKKYLLYLLPNIIFEIITGKRTTAFIYVFFIYLIFCITNKKTYFKQLIITMSVLLFSVLFSRLSSQLFSPHNRSDLNAIHLLVGASAEFLNTYLTLPFIIENNLVGTRGLLFAFYDMISGFLPGSLQLHIMESLSFYEWGDTIARYINLGYGFSCNAITFFLGLFGYVGIAGIPIVYFIIYLLDQKYYSLKKFLFSFFLIIQSRLFIRQGFPALASYFYISIVYVLFFYMNKKRKGVV